MDRFRHLQGIDGQAEVLEVEHSFGCGSLGYTLFYLGQILITA